MTTAVEIQGTLREDGTLVLDEKPNLPPGRATVKVQSSATEEGTDVVSVLARIHTAQATRGHVPRSKEEIDAELAEMRDDEDRSLLIERIQEESRRQREEQPPPEAT